MSAIEMYEPAEAPIQPHGGALAERQAAPVTIAQGSDATTQLLAIAVQRGASMEELRELLQLRREMREDEERERKLAAELAYRRDFAAFSGENIIIPKSKHVDRGRAGSFMQAEFDNVKRLLSPALSKHGFGFRHDQRFGVRDWPTAEDQHNKMGWVWVTCFIEHRDGHTEKLELEGPPDEQTANTPVQNMQSTASYLKRQSLLAITGTATGGEDDESQMKGKRGQEDAQEEDGGELATLLNAGQDAATLGMAALTSWWGKLDARKRAKLQNDFKAWRRAAAQFDGDAK